MEKMSKLAEICIDIYRDMYAKSTPKADFDKLMADGTTKKPGWYLDYELDADEQQKIIDHHVKKNKLTKRQERSISVEVYLGCSPSSRKTIHIKKD